MPPRKNYTEREKRDLLTVVNKYKSILENKSTNAVSIEKKKQSWEKVAREFNAGAEFPRSAKQLSTAYQNSKRLTRQNVAEENIKKYNLKTEEEELKKFKKDDSHDKKEIKATGGGTFRPALSEVGAQMLAIMGDQIKPLSNNCDSASDYHKIGEDIADQSDDSIVVDYYDRPGPSRTTSTQQQPPQPQECYSIDLEVEPLEDQEKTVKKAVLVQSKLRRSQTTAAKGQEKKKFENTIVMKRKFYKKKLESALIEKRIKIAEFKLILTKQKVADLELKIKELQYSALLQNSPI